MVAFFAVPSVAWSDLKQFIPKITGTEGELETDMSMESNTNSANDRGLDTRYTLISEKLRIGASGYIYHPRFIVFLAKVGGGFNQENLSNNELAEKTGWRNVATEEYEFRAIILPEHPYNLEVYAIRANPFLPGRVVPGISSLTYDKGAILKYKKMPFTAVLSYATSEIKSLDSDVKSKALNANAGYVQDWISASVAGTRSESSAFSTSSTSDYYSTQNQIQLLKRRLYLVSDASLNTLHQDSLSESLSDRRFAWNEQLGAELPWNFNANIFYNHFNDSSESSGVGIPSSGTLSEKSDNASLSITHRLYASLLTSYNLSYVKSHSQAGDFQVMSNAINASYVKTIPGGRMIATVLADTSSTDETGTPTVINEVHNAAIFGQFSLGKPDIDVPTISIRVKDPDSGILFDLQNNVNYLVFQVGNTVQIVIISLPAQVQGTKPPDFLYEFQVTYSIISQNARIQTNDFGYSVKFELFNFLSPYYSYTRTTQKLISGTLLGGVEDSTSYTAGVSVDRQPYRVMFEYQKVDSRFNPLSGFRTEAEYIKALTATMNIFAKIYYTKINYPVSEREGSIGYTETAYGGDVRAQKTFPTKNMVLTGAASYANRTGLVATTTYSFNSALTWKIAKLDISLGANLGRTVSELSAGREESLYQYYYLVIKRKLF